MRTYYEVIKYVKGLLDADEDVNTVTSGNRTEIDNYKKNIYPIANVYIEESPFINKVNTAVTRYNVEVTVLDIRDNNKEQILDKFWYNDNRHDNWNLTRAILKRLHNKLIKTVNDENICLENATSVFKIDNGFKNNLDGWTQNFTIDVEDDWTTIC